MAPPWVFRCLIRKAPSWKVEWRSVPLPNCTSALPFPFWSVLNWPRNGQPVLGVPLKPNSHHRTLYVVDGFAPASVTRKKKGPDRDSP